MLRRSLSRGPTRATILAAIIVVVGTTGAALAAAHSSAPAPAAALGVPARAGPDTAIPGFLIQSSSKVTDDAAVSRPGFSTTGWYRVGARSTVFAGLLVNNRYPDPFYSTNLKSANPSDFTVPWWYRAELNLGTETGLRTSLDFS